MEIISISLDEEKLEEINKIQKILGFGSRSKMICSTINSLVNEYKIMETLKGHIDSVFVITYKESEKNRVSDILHHSEEMIKTSVHQHHVGICLEVLVICGNAKHIRELFGKLKADKGVRSVTCSVL